MDQRRNNVFERGHLELAQLPCPLISIGMIGIVFLRPHGGHLKLSAKSSN